jgi:putative inorganic carbon (hco3(-)) transporter
MAAIPGSIFSSWRRLFVFALVLVIAGSISYLATKNATISALILVGGLLAGVVFLWPWMLIPVIFFLIYSNTIVVAVHYHSVPNIIGTLVPALLLIPFLKSIFIDRERVVINPTLILMIAFVAIKAVGAIYATDPNLAMNLIVNFLTEGVLLYFLVVNVVRTPKLLKFCTWAVILAGLFMGAISFYQELTHTYDNNYWGFAQWGTSFGTGQSNLLGDVIAPRLEGPIGDDNRYAQVMIVIAPLAIFLAIGEQDKKFKLLPMAATFFIIIGALLTYSRGGLVAIAVIVFLMFILKTINLRYLAVLLVFVILLPVAVPNFAKRLDSFQNITLSGLLNNSSDSGILSTDSSVQGRATEMISAALMFADYPIFGVGSGNYAVHYPEYAPKAGFIVRLANRQPHTLYGGIAAENGIFGITCFLMLVFLTLRDLYRARRAWLETNFMLASISTGLFLGVIAYMVTGVFLHATYIRFFWLIMGIAGAAINLNQHGIIEEKKVAL